jgi:hypothetical protein
MKAYYKSFKFRDQNLLQHLAHFSPAEAVLLMRRIAAFINNTPSAGGDDGGS